VGGHPAKPPVAHAGATTAAKKPPAAPTQAATTAASTPPRPIHIADAFTDDFRDGTIWHQVVSGTGGTIGQSGGRLVVSIGADAVAGGQYNVIEAHYGTQCTFTGDFDARIDFTLLDWPSGNGVSAGFWAFFADAAIVRHSTASEGETYGAWAIPVNDSTSLADTSGSLRIARANGVLTTYFWHEGRWISLASHVERGSAVLGPAVQATNEQFGHEAVSVAFDDFSVDADARDVSCPPGSTPPGA